MFGLIPTLFKSRGRHSQALDGEGIIGHLHVVCSGVHGAEDATDEDTGHSSGVCAAAPDARHQGLPSACEKIALDTRYRTVPDAQTAEGVEGASTKEGIVEDGRYPSCLEGDTTDGDPRTEAASIDTQGPSDTRQCEVAGVDGQKESGGELDNNVGSGATRSASARCRHDNADAVRRESVQRRFRAKEALLSDFDLERRAKEVALDDFDPSRPIDNSDAEQPPKTLAYSSDELRQASAKFSKEVDAYIALVNECAIVASARRCRRRQSSANRSARRCRRRGTSGSMSKIINVKFAYDYELAERRRKTDIISRAD